MEEYEEMENDAPDSSDTLDASATTATSNRQEHELSSQSGQMVQGRGVGLRRNRVGNLGVLKATSGNATKRSTSRVTTSAGNLRRQSSSNSQPKSSKRKKER